MDKPLEDEVKKIDTQEDVSDSTLISGDDDDVDIALKFLNHKNAKDYVSEEDEETDTIKKNFYGSSSLPPKLLRKIDFWVLTFLCFTYLLMFLDKALLNYAASMGIKKHLKGDDFSNLGTIFYASYIFMEPIVSFLLQKYSLSKVMGSFIACWGIVLACHCACKSYASLMIVRTLLGVFESSSAVGCITISGMYYTKSEQCARIGYWTSQAGTGYIVGGLISFGFLHYHGKEFASWQIMFLVVGLFTLLFGLVTFVVLPDNVTNAWFLSDEEKILVVRHIKDNQTGLENKKFKWAQIKELFLHDKLTWPMLAITACSQMTTGAIGTFSVTITQTFGFDAYVTALLQLPIGAISVIIMVVVTQMMSKWGQITLVTTSMYIPTIIGCIVMLSLSLSHKIGNLFALYLLYSGSSVIVNIYVWNSLNTSGYSKRIFRNAATLMVYSLAYILAPQTFREANYPEYVPAKITLLVTQCICIPLQLYVGYVCLAENKKRDREQDGKREDKYEFRDLTDIQNRNFRYMY